MSLILKLFQIIVKTKNIRYFLLNTGIILVFNRKYERIIMNKPNDKKLDLIGNWLYKVKDGLINDEILLFFDKRNFSLNGFSKLLNTLNIKNKIITLGNISNKVEYELLYLINDLNYVLLKDKIDFKKTNIVLFSSDPNIITSYLDNKTSFIFSDYTVDNFSYINKYNIELYSSTDPIEKKDRLKFYLEKKDPISLINSDSKTFQEYLFYKITNLKQPFSKFINFIIRDTKYEKYLENKTLFYKMIQFEVSLLREKRILTATLAILTYRIATLDLIANKTNIGTFYRKRLGIGSENLYNLDKLLEHFNSKDIEEFLKQAKTYDLNKSQIILSNEDNLKIRIAKKLLLRNELKLTYEEIQEITELSSDLMNLVLE